MIRSVKLCVLAVALYSQAIAHAEDPPTVDDRVVLWGSIRVGMSKAEFKALYPNGEADLFEGCKTIILPEFENKAVKTVTLEASWKDTSDRCGNAVEAALSEKYGVPEDYQEEVVRNDCGNPYASGFAGKVAQLCRSLNNPETIYEHRTWRTESIEISLKTEANSAKAWWLRYQRVMKIPRSSIEKF